MLPLMCCDCTLSIYPLVGVLPHTNERQHTHYRQHTEHTICNTPAAAHPTEQAASLTYNRHQTSGGHQAAARPPGGNKRQPSSISKINYKAPAPNTSHLHPITVTCFVWHSMQTSHTVAPRSSSRLDLTNYLSVPTSGRHPIFGGNKRKTSCFYIF